MELRKSSISSLFEELKHVGIPLDEKGFEILSKSYDNPEEMALDLCIDNPEAHASLLPIIYEAWRRLCPEKYTISLFGKELDYLIENYENGTLENPEDLYQALAQLQNLLEENSEESDAFSLVQEYVDYDLEGFLYVFILNEIELNEVAYAHDLIEGFFPFVSEKIWFEYLLARVLILEDIEEGYEKIEELLESKLKDEKNLDLNLEILLFLAESGNHSLFLQLAWQTSEYLETEEDFLDFAEIIEQHYRTLDIETLSQTIKKILNSRTPRPLNMPLSHDDPDLLQIHKVLNHKILTH